MIYDKKFDVIVHEESFRITVCHEWFCDMFYRDVDAVEEIAESFISEYYFVYPTARSEAKAVVKEQIEKNVLQHIKYLKSQQIKPKGKTSWLKRLLSIF